jgi:tRNA G46 methylase TrmB
MTQGWQDKVGGQLVFESDWRKIVEMGLAHIDAKRKALKLDAYDPKRYAKSETYLPGDVYTFAEFSKGSRTRPK